MPMQCNKQDVGSELMKSLNDSSLLHFLESIWDMDGDDSLMSEVTAANLKGPRLEAERRTGRSF